MKIKSPTIAIAIILITCVIIDLDLKNWKKTEKVIEHDIHWYYGYLPAQFIYNDIELIKSDYQYGDNLYWFWTSQSADGKKIIKTTMGLSMLYAPFFFVAHAYALTSDYPKTGFSEPYKLFLLLSTLFYFLVGLDFVKKILCHYSFSDAHIAITLLLLGMGTNILCYASQSAPMPHVYVFCLIAIFIYFTIKWYTVQSAINTIVLGLLFGLISLIRPSNVIIAFFFLLYNVTNWNDFKARIAFLIQKPMAIAGMLLLTFVVWIPQFLYWKIITGNYISYSYNDEGFFFLQPHIMDGLFGFRKGWLLYTPIMAFAIGGIFLLKGELKKLRISISVFLILNIYIILSWWCWWYGGTYGQRSFIDSYALMALPLASFVKVVSEKRWIIKIVFFCMAVFFIWLNIFQTYQIEFASLHWDAMTKELYFKQFGKLEKIKDFEKYLNYPDYELAKNGGEKMGSVIDVEKKTVLKKVKLKAANGKFVCADQRKNNYLVARSDNGWAWETFEIIYLNDSQINLKASTGKFVSADHTVKDAIVANQPKAQAWEAFTLIMLENNFVALKADNGKYLSVDKKTLQLSATSNTLGEQEKFELSY